MKSFLRSERMYHAIAWLAAAAIVVLSMFVVWREWRESRAMAELVVHNTALVLAHQVEHSFDQADALLLSVARRYIQASGGGEREYRRFVETVRLEVPYFPLVARIGVANRDGDVIFNTGYNSENQPQVNLADRDYFRRARDGTRDLMYVGPLHARLNGEWALSLVRRLESTDGVFLGVVFAILPVETIGKQFSKIDLGPGGIINLRTIDYAQVARYPALSGTNRGVGNRNVSQTVLNLMRNRPGQDFYLYQTVAPIDGIKRVYVYQKFSHSPFWMTVGRSTADFGSTWKQTAMLLAVLSLGISWFLLRGARRLDRYNQTLEQRIAERTQNLADSERFVRMVTDAIPGMIGYWDAGLRNRFANHSYQSWFGKNPEEMPGIDIRDLLGPALFSLNEPHIRAALRGEAQRFERTLTKMDGSVRYTWANYIPDIADGQVRGFIVHVSDITELKEAEIRIQRQARELDDLYNNAPCGYYSLDVHGTITGLNNTIVAWLGYSREEAVTKRRLSDFLAPPSVEVFQRQFRTFLGDGIISELELDFVRKDGEIFSGLVSATAERDEQGNVVMCRLIVVDYTRLRQEQETLRKVLSAAPMAVRIATLQDNRVVFMNRAFCDLVRRSADEAKNMDISRNYVDPAVFDDIRQRLCRGETVMNQLVRLYLPDRPEVPRVWALGSYMNMEYEGRGAVLTWLFDVTELQEAKSAAESANKELDAFAYAVSHDLRAPLRAMNGFAAALIEDYGDKLDGDAGMYLAEIMKASTRMGALIDGILKLSRSSRGELQCEDVNLSELAAEALADLRRAEPHRRITCEIAEGLVVKGDKAMLSTVMQNLIGNAWKYSAKNPEAVISVYGERKGPVMHFCVADNGAGFGMEHAGLLFKPFQRLHRQDEFPGIGIGLATVQRIIHRHGGEIEARSELGKGAVFSFSLPPA